jgi:hypothetical protein
MLRKHLLPAAALVQDQVAIKDMSSKICPFCKKTFSRLASHIKKSHPDDDFVSSSLQIKEEPEEVQEEPMSEEPMQLAFNDPGETEQVKGTNLCYIKCTPVSVMKNYEKKSAKIGKNKSL